MGSKCGCVEQVISNDNNKVISVDINAKPILNNDNIARRSTVDSALTSTAISSNMSNLNQTQKKSSGNVGKLISQPRNSAFLNRTIIYIGVFGYLQSGKKSFVKRLIEDAFDSEPSTIASKKTHKKIPFNGKSYDVQFIIYPFEDSTPNRQLDFFCVLYDVNSEESLQMAKNMIHRNLQQKVKIDADAEIKSNLFLIGNKCDDGKGLIKGEEYCRKNNYKYYEISNRNNVGLGRIMEDIVQCFDKLEC